MHEAATDPTLFDIPTSETERQVGLYDRLNTVYEVADFYPTSRTEINEAFGLLDGGSVLVATARHLNEIHRHQQKADTDDPAAAVRSVTNLYAAYAQKARVDLTFLMLLNAELHDPDLVNYRLSLQDLDVQDGVSQFARFMDLRALGARHTTDGLLVDPLATGKREKRDAFDPYTSTTPASDVLHRLEVARKASVQETRTMLPAAVADQSARRDFWVRALEGAARYRISRPVAIAALESLGVGRGR